MGKKDKKSVGELQEEGEFSVKPTSEGPKLTSDKWPLLLKVAHYFG